MVQITNLENTEAQIKIQLQSIEIQKNGYFNLPKFLQTFINLVYWKSKQML